MSAKHISTAPLVVERIFNAPVAKVWQALTNVEEMRRWYFDLKEFKPQPGFKFQFAIEHEGNQYDHRCKVTAAIPQEKIAYTWRYEGQEGDSLVTFELFVEGDKTKLKLTHEGWETFPKLPAYARKNFEQGWMSLIGESLKDYLENADREIVNARQFNASRELVWEAITDPHHVAKWWGPQGFSTTIESMDVRPGGADYHNKSVFIEVVKPKRLVYQHLEPIHKFQMTMILDNRAGGTLLTWRMLFESVEECAKLKNFISDANEQNFDRLQAHLSEMA